MNQNESNNRRRRYRLRFPEDAMLKATIQGQPYKVIEVAEHSLCIKSRNVKNLDGHCAGIIYWSDGTETEFIGEVGERVNLGRLILNVQGITTSHIVAETRRLIVRYPMWES
jgi:hypothetical protein